MSQLAEVTESPVAAQSTAEIVGSVRRLTQSLLEHASEANWTDVVNIEAKRAALLHKLFGDATRMDSSEARALITDILSADQKITSLAKLKREELAQSARKIGRGRSAIKAYDLNAR